MHRRNQSEIERWFATKGMRLKIKATLHGLACLFAWGVVTLHVSDSPAADHFVDVQFGDLPIILSAPHGGRDPIAGASSRVGVGVKAFNSVPDLSTDRLTYQLADAIEQTLGKRPQIVVALFHRKYVDANRRESRAYESDAGKIAYDAFHQSLGRVCDQVVERWGRGLLLDIHGQNTQTHAVLRGTADGKTTSHLVSRFGMPSLIGPQSLIGFFASNGLPVIPAVGSSEAEPSRYRGGFIVDNYGSRNGGTIDAIQLEIGKDLRRYDARPATAEKMAVAIASFAKLYLPSDQ